MRDKTTLLQGVAADAGERGLPAVLLRPGTDSPEELDQCLVYRRVG
ncbi:MULTISPECIES: hypothetical protein [Streptomyces]|nr:MULTISPECIES: hypothetical protein [Streptomyces]